MRIFSWEDFVGGSLSDRPFAATIGVFDGLHIGHRELIRRVLERKGFASLVLTFKENPKRILSPQTHQGELSTLDQKLELIELMGVHFCVLIDFSGDFSKLPGRRFLSLLRESGEFRFLAVGADFRCGKGLDTDASGIRSFCESHSIGVELVQALGWSGHPVSSSRIRKAILDGRLEDAASMLGRPYEIDLRGAIVSSGGSVEPRGAQARPPRGMYEASLVSGAEGSALSVSAELGASGRWSFTKSVGGGQDDAAFQPGRESRGLRLVRLVSRE